MGYYIRVLAEDAVEVPVADLCNALPEGGAQAVIRLEEGTKDQWSELLLKHRDSAGFR